LVAVLVYALGDGALDLGVGPAADALGLARGDVARHRGAPRAGEFAAAGAHGVLEIHFAVDQRGVAFHAVTDGGEIEAARDLIFQVAFFYRLLGTGENLVLHRELVDRVWHLVFDRLDALHVGHDGIEIARQQNVVKAGRHHHDR